LTVGHVERTLKATAQQEEGMAPDDTKDRIVRAAIEVIKSHGYAGSSARAIAAEGGFNQALIFYHFGSVRNALLAALDRTSDERMQAYRTAAAGAGDLPALVAVAAEIYHEDLASGHIKVLAELIAGASTDPELGPEIVTRIAPWIDFARAEIERVVGGSPLGQVVPAKDAAYALVAQFLGLELLTHLDGSSERADRLFRLAGGLATMVSMPRLTGDPA
jgi:AcrR family transcriptional regulator